MNYKHATEILEALKADPSSVDLWAVDQWRPITCVMNNFQHLCLRTLENPEKVRIRPTPRKVPFGPEDIKPGMVFRIVKTTVTSWRYPECVENGGVLIFGAWHSWASLMQSFEWSNDAITWHPCEKPLPPPPKREPRRVWVNIYPHETTLPGFVSHPTMEEAIKSASNKVEERAVEFVEVVKE